MDDPDSAERGAAFARELFSRHLEFASVIRDEPDDALLYGLAVDLGNTLLDLAEDSRLKTLLAGNPPAGDLDGRLAEALLVDWSYLLERFGYEPPPPAEDRANDVRESILSFASSPRQDTYQRLVVYLTDLGNRLVESDRPDGLPKDRRIRRRVGRGLWVLTRVALAAAAGSAVALIPPLGLAAGAAVAGVTSAVGSDVAKALVEKILPEDWLALEAKEDVELAERSERLNDLLDFGRMGLLRGSLEFTAANEATPGRAFSVRFSADALLWISLVQGSLLALRSLGAASDSGLPRCCDFLSLALIDLRVAVRENADAGRVAAAFDKVSDAAQKVSMALVEAGLRRHRR